MNELAWRELVSEGAVPRLPAVQRENAKGIHAARDGV